MGKYTTSLSFGQGEISQSDLNSLSYWVIWSWKVCVDIPTALWVLKKIEITSHIPYKGFLLPFYIFLRLNTAFCGKPPSQNRY
jgi:hypothetical protein